MTEDPGEVILGLIVSAVFLIAAGTILESILPFNAVLLGYAFLVFAGVIIGAFLTIGFLRLLGEVAG